MMRAIRPSCCYDTFPESMQQQACTALLRVGSFHPVQEPPRPLQQLLAGPANEVAAPQEDVQAVLQLFRRHQRRLLLLLLLLFLGGLLCALL
jgi:hypothetical protein